MPLGRIKIIRHNGTNDFSDNSNLSVSESLGSVAPPLVSPLVTGPNSKKKFIKLTVVNGELPGSSTIVLDRPL